MQIWIDLDSRTKALFVPGGIVIKSIVWLADGGEGSEAMVYVPCHDHLGQAWLQNMEQQVAVEKEQCAAKAAAAACAAEQPAAQEAKVADVIPFHPADQVAAPVEPTPEPAA